MTFPPYAPGPPVDSAEPCLSNHCECGHPMTVQLDDRGCWVGGRHDPRRETMVLLAEALDRHHPASTPAGAPSACTASPRPPPAPVVVGTFTARLDGRCRGCDLPVAVGQRIHRLSDDSYRHVGCQP